MSGISVRFWGVRGGIACGANGVSRYGGNTSCVEVRCGQHLLILDGGTGLRLLGKNLIKNAVPVDADIFYSHCHLDHICGLPFFDPCYVPTSRLRLWADNLASDVGLAEAVDLLMSAPLFPITFDSFKAKIGFRNFRVGDVLRPHPAITVRTAPLNHPGGSTGYRIEYDGRSVAYITDTEHCPAELDRKVLELAADVDLMIYDSNFTDEEWPAHRGWGHSTWQEGVRLANEARARSLALFHHDPEHDDEILDRVAAEARLHHRSAFVAAEGMTFLL
jgi:phosphoribosyl 1,2-cyclic phosphodiesterase